MPVEGIPDRDTPVTFCEQHLSYFPGEIAAFTAQEAADLLAIGMVDPPDPPPPPPEGEGERKAPAPPARDNRGAHRR
jgi:hypothetical protein